MRTVTALFLLMFYSGLSSGQPSQAVSGTELSLREDCGYELGSILLSSVKESKVSKSKSITIVHFKLDMPTGWKRISAKLDFGCNRKGDKQDSRAAEAMPSDAVTAKSEILSEDAGGRYSRIVSWEREYRAENFVGTVANVRAVFGDGVKTEVPEQFFVCPKPSGMTCFLLELEKMLRLTEKERAAIILSLENVKLTGDLSDR